MSPVHLGACQGKGRGDSDHPQGGPLGLEDPIYVGLSVCMCDCKGPLSKHTSVHGCVLARPWRTQLLSELSASSCPFPGRTPSARRLQTLRESSPTLSHQVLRAGVTGAHTMWGLPGVLGSVLARGREGFHLFSCLPTPGHGTINTCLKK